MPKVKAEAKIKAKAKVAPKVKVKVAVKKAPKSGGTKSAEVKELPKETGLKQSVYDTKGKVVENITLPKEIFDVKVNNNLMSQAVRVFLSNRRKGTVKTKSRGEVNKTTKKVYRQKGTGRARHGAMSAPIYVGGGVAFGPRPRDYSLSLPQKMKRAALFSALTVKVQSGEVKILTGLEKIEPKTKLMADVLKNLSLEEKNKKLLLVMADSKTENVRKSARNIKGLSILEANLLNTYQVLDNKGIILMKGAIETIEKSFLKEKVK